VITIRRLEPGDREPIREIVKETGVFSDGEVGVAIELVDIVLCKPGQTDYEIFSAVDDARTVIGYYCIGQRPLTDGTFDLYWIAVKPSIRNRGIGTQLLRHAEERIKSHGGRLVLAETSSRPSYENTRQFYLHNRYDELARIRNFYRVGDDLVVYGKYVSPSGGT
jgi:ribosomal protein S18 acetylase RimI-like enzyme